MATRSSFAREVDTRRNLYILGIPVDLCQFVTRMLAQNRIADTRRARRDDLTSLFSAHGTVEHAVIMATLDQFNRRRGFIVMRTHEQAKVAMRAMSGVEIKYAHSFNHACLLKSCTEGFSFTFLSPSSSALKVRPSRIRALVSIDVAGFLDGGDRAPRRKRSNLGSPLSSPFSPSSTLSSSAASSPDCTIVALNLCPLALPCAADVHALFSRVGAVRAVRLARGEPGTAVIAFENAEDAGAALNLLDGVPVGSFVVRLMSAML